MSLQRSDPANRELAGPMTLQAPDLRSLWDFLCRRCEADQKHGCILNVGGDAFQLRFPRLSRGPS